MPVILKEITPRNILSFGVNTSPIPLGALSIITDTDGKATSDFMEVMCLLKGLGWVDNRYFYPYPEPTDRWPSAGQLDASFDFPMSPGQSFSISYTVRFDIDSTNNVAKQEASSAYFEGYPFADDDADGLVKSLLTYAEILRGKYFQRKNFLWNKEKSGLTNGILNEDLANFRGLLFINHKDRLSKISEEMKIVIEDFHGMKLSDAENSWNVLFQIGDETIAAPQAEESMLKYLSLCAILVYPRCNMLMHRMICIEEPEKGLTADMLAPLADMLERASEHYQIIITTQSQQLLEAFSHRPEVILVGESSHGATQIRPKFLVTTTS